MKPLAVAIALALTSQHASATPGTVPEPGVLPLLAMGAAAGLVIWARNRKKK